MNAISYPRNWLLIGGLCLLQLLVIVLPVPISGLHISSLIVLSAILTAVLLSSVSNTILFLLFISAVIPGEVSREHLTLPMGIKFSEGVFLVVVTLVMLTALLERTRPVHTVLDRPLTVFLGLVAVSCAVGLYHGVSTSQMLRDVRYPCYYTLFFVAKQFIPTHRARRVLMVVVLIAAVVGLEYMVEFFSLVNLSVAGQFERVARPAGLMFPIGSLIIGAMWLYGGNRQDRLFATLALIPISLAFVLTVGRGMWIAAVVGLMALSFLYLRDRQREGMQGVLTILALPCTVLILFGFFQGATETGVGATAFRRLARIQTAEQDHSISGRLLSYQVAITKIIRRPIIGGGHGEVVEFYDTHASTPGLNRLGAVGNLYLTLMLRMGLIGLIAFLWLYSIALLTAYRLFQTSRDPDTRLFAASFFTVYSAMLVYGMADPTLMVTRLILIHATMLGVLASLAAHEERGESR